LGTRNEWAKTGSVGPAAGVKKRTAEFAAYLVGFLHFGPVTVTAVVEEAAVEAEMFVAAAYHSSRQIDFLHRNCLSSRLLVPSRMTQAEAEVVSETTILYLRFHCICVDPAQDTTLLGEEPSDMWTR